MAVWIDKKVFCKTITNKCFEGMVVEETENSIVLIDKFNHQVLLNKSELCILKEEN